jgi:hypothetical protein
MASVIILGAGKPLRTFLAVEVLGRLLCFYVEAHAFYIFFMFLHYLRKLVMLDLLSPCLQLLFVSMFIATFRSRSRSSCVVSTVDFCLQVFITRDVTLFFRRRDSDMLQAVISLIPYIDRCPV